MAKPRVFVSSTYYDLKHLRASMETFIQSLGFEAVLSEKGNIAYSPELPLDESCYREAAGSDMLVLIIGGRYGAEASEERGEVPKTFYDRYESITKLEHKHAVENDIPVYVLIESPVDSEFQTFQKNKDNPATEYAHVDSVNIFHLIEKIRSQRRNNPIHVFSRYSEIEEWLKEQWAGQFRELLTRRASERQFSSLSAEVTQLSEINKTLKIYLESLMEKISPEGGDELIKSESERLQDAEVTSRLKEVYLIEFATDDLKLEFESVRGLLENEGDEAEIYGLIDGLAEQDKGWMQLRNLLRSSDTAQEYWNEARQLVNRPAVDFSKFSDQKD